MTARHACVRARLACGVLAAVLACAAGTAVAQERGKAAAERGEILERLGVAALALRDHAEAVRYFRAALAAGRDRADLRYRLGFALAEMDRCGEAVDELEVAMRQEPRGRTALQLGRCYQRIGKRGVAVHWLEDAVWAGHDLTPIERRDAYGALAFLYTDEGQLARAAEAWRQRLSFGHDPEAIVHLARVERLLGARAKASSTLSTIVGRDLPPAVEAARLDEVAALARDDGRLPDAVAALEAANAAEETAARHHRLGLLFRDAGRTGDSVRHLARAHALAPAEAEYAMALGYAYVRAGRHAEASALFESVLAREPERLGLARELGYLSARRGDTPQAIAWFTRALDAEDAERARLQREIARMSPHFDVTASFTYRPSMDQPRAGSGALGGTLPSQSGIEVAYQPPVIGFRDERIFQIFARLLWSFDPGSFEIDGESWQAGIGVRYKPFRTHNVFLSAERLIGIGDDAIDDWLLRALYSWEHRQAPEPAWTWWNYSTVFGDAGYFAERGVWALYGEVRQGITWRPLPALRVTPHVVVDGRYQEAGGPTDSFIEGGGGVSLRWAFWTWADAVERASLELLFQYKAGRFFDRSGRDESFHGPVVGLVLRF